MKQKVKDFIEKYIDVIEDNSLEFVFKQSAAELSTDEICELSEILEGINIPTENIRWKVFDQVVIDYVKYNLALPAYQRDKSNSWARVDYMLSGISNLGFGWSEAKEHVITNQKALGLRCRKLSPQYGWEGSGDYAFQWFDEHAFDKEYSYDE